MCVTESLCATHRVPHHSRRKRREEKKRRREAIVEENDFVKWLNTDCDEIVPLIEEETKGYLTAPHRTRRVSERVIMSDDSHEEKYYTKQIIRNRQE